MDYKGSFFVLLHWFDAVIKVTPLFLWTGIRWDLYFIYLFFFTFFSLNFPFFIFFSAFPICIFVYLHENSLKFWLMYKLVNAGGSGYMQPLLFSLQPLLSRFIVNIREMGSEALSPCLHLCIAPCASPAVCVSPPYPGIHWVLGSIGFACARMGSDCEEGGQTELGAGRSEMWAKSKMIIGPLLFFVFLRQVFSV